MWRFKILYLIIQKVLMLCSICAKIKKKKECKIKIQYLTSTAQGPANRNQVVIRVRAEYCDNLQRRTSHLLMKKRHLLLLSSPSVWLWVLMAVTYSFLLIWCTPHRKRLWAHKVFFQLSAPYVSNTRVGNEVESYSARHEQIECRGS